MEKLKNRIISFLPETILRRYRSYVYRTRKNSIIEEWERNGNPLPAPHVVKQAMIEKYQRKKSYQILIETGTFQGDMVEAQRKKFKQIFSIELSKDLFKEAKKRFRNYSHIKIIQGDSGKVLKDLILQIHEPVLFWLDGHYSGGITAKGDLICPIYHELDSILQLKVDFTILIDDARLFVGKDDYPTLQELESYVSQSRHDLTFFIQNDVIIIEKKTDLILDPKY
jgi:hypothetical protein